MDADRNRYTDGIHIFSYLHVTVLKKCCDESAEARRR